MPILEVTHLRVTYDAAGAPVQALRGVTLRVDKCDAVGVVGESGSGRTTLALSTLRRLPGEAAIEGSCGSVARSWWERRPMPSVATAGGRAMGRGRLQNAVKDAILQIWASPSPCVTFLPRFETSWRPGPLAPASASGVPERLSRRRSGKANGCRRHRPGQGPGVLHRCADRCRSHPGRARRRAEVTGRITCDASVLVALLVDSGSAGRWATRMLTSAGDLLAPHLALFEAANILRRHQLAQVISADQAAQAHADLLDLPIDLWGYEILAPRVWQLRENLSAYDGSYVALAEMTDTVLATLDRRMARTPGVRCAVAIPGS